MNPFIDVIVEYWEVVLSLPIWGMLRVFLVKKYSLKYADVFAYHLALQAKDRHTDMPVRFVDLKVVYKDRWWQWFFLIFDSIRKATFQRLTEMQVLCLINEKNFLYEFRILDNQRLLSEVRREKDIS